MLLTPEFALPMARSFAKIFMSRVTRGLAPAVSPTISKSTRFGFRTSAAHCIRLKLFSGLTRRLGKLLHLTNSDVHRTSSRMAFTSFVAARTRVWSLRSTAQVEWTTSSSGKRCRSTACQRDCYLRTIACKSATSERTFSPARSVEILISRWRATIRSTARRSR